MFKNIKKLKYNLKSSKNTKQKLIFLILKYIKRMCYKTIKLNSENNTKRIKIPPLNQ